MRPLTARSRPPTRYKGKEVPSACRAAREDNVEGTTPKRRAVSSEIRGTCWEPESTRMLTGCHEEVGLETKPRCTAGETKPAVGAGCKVDEDGSEALLQPSSERAEARAQVGARAAGDRSTTPGCQYRFPTGAAGAAPPRERWVLDFQRPRSPVGPQHRRPRAQEHRTPWRHLEHQAPG